MTAGSSLYDLAVRYGSDKAAHGYCPLYERHLGQYRFEQFWLVEVGVAEGASLRMWRDYFPRAQIIGVDKNPSTMIEGETRIHTVCGDGALPRIWREMGTFPFIIIDDGSHLAEEVIGTWTYGWPKLRAGGWYAVEDIGAQFCVEFGGTDPDGSVATTLLNEVSTLAFRGREVAEYHAYQQLAMFRRAT